MIMVAREIADKHNAKYDGGIANPDRRLRQLLTTKPFYWGLIFLFSRVIIMSN